MKHIKTNYLKSCRLVFQFAQVADLLQQLLFIFFLKEKYKKLVLEALEIKKQMFFQHLGLNIQFLSMHIKFYTVFTRFHKVFHV